MKNLKDFNWNHLYCFYEVAKVSSLKKAAAVLKLSSSTISEQLARLEEVVEKKLFTRHSRGLIMTLDGEKIYAYAAKIFETGSRMIDSISKDAIGGYPVKVGIVETLSNNIAMEFVSQYWDMFSPYGTVDTVRELEFGNLRDDIVNGVVDWGICLNDVNSRRLNCRKIGAFEIIFCCSSKIYSRFKRPKDIISSIPLVRSSWDLGLNQKIDQYLRKSSIRPKEYVESDHFEYLTKLCLRGRCVMYVADNPRGIFSGLKKFQINSPVIVELFAVWRRSDEQMISIKKLIDLLEMHHGPKRYDDQELQIEVSDVAEDLLNKIR